MTVGREGDVFVYQSRTTACRWFFNKEKDMFDWLTMPFIFRNASEEIQNALIEHLRECARAQESGMKRDDPNYPKIPKNVLKFRYLPKNRILLSAGTNHGQSRLEAFL